MVVHDGHVTHVHGIGILETVKGLGVVKCFDLGLVQSLAELAPHGIQHHFSQGAQPCILLDLIVLQLDAFVLVVLAKVLLTFGFVVAYPRRPPAGFLLDFQPGVDVVSEEPLTGLVKLPHLVNVLDLVPQRHRFVQFRGAPRAGQDALLDGVGALDRSLPKAFWHFVLDTRCTEGKEEFALMAVRQHGMVEVARREDTALDKAKVEVDVGVTRLRNEARMPFGVHTGFVHPRVQGGDIDVMDLLTMGNTMVQFDGLGTTSTEGITWVERVDEGQVIHKRLDLGGGVFEAGPFPAPHLNDIVPEGLKVFDFLVGWSRTHPAWTDHSGAHVFRDGWDNSGDIRDRNNPGIRTRCGCLGSSHPRGTWYRGCDTRRHCGHVECTGDDWDGDGPRKPGPAGAVGDRTRLTIRGPPLTG